MFLYEKIDKIPFLRKSYTNKFLFVAFLGIHIPLIGVTLYVFANNAIVSTSFFLIVTLALTLIATLITLLVLKKLIEPIELASRAMLNYQNSKLVPELPMHFKDETGVLLATIQTSIDNNEKYLKDKQDLIYLLSHDLRGFTANVKGLAALIKEEDSTEMITEYAEMIELTTEQQLAFIATCIQLIKEEDEIYGKDSTLTLINLKEIVQDVFDQLLARLGAKKIDLKIQIDIPNVMLTIDKELLTRVLFNLVDNAIKFSYPSSIITINAGLDNAKLRISVSDQGLGFKPEDGIKLFDKFTTKGRVGTNNEASTGIGLYLCKRIVEKYMGSIDAKSEGMNKGAIFSIVLDAQ